MKNVGILALQGDVSERKPFSLETRISDKVADWAQKFVIQIFREKRSCIPKRNYIKVGILALQGDVSENMFAVEMAMKNLKINGHAVEIREKNEIHGINALIIPGGESTTIGRLISKNNLGAEIKKLAKREIPIMGTCAGLILLAKKGDSEVKKTKQPLLGLMDIKVERNAFGRQRESFEADIKVSCIGKNPFHAVFIRAPAIKSVWGNAKILAKFENRIVMAQEKNLLAIAFHPELGNDLRIHEYFLKLIKK